jgi:hypothetical protein
MLLKFYQNFIFNNILTNIFLDRLYLHYNTIIYIDFFLIRISTVVKIPAVSKTLGPFDMVNTYVLRFMKIRQVIPHERSGFFISIGARYIFKNVPFYHL